MSNQPPPRGNPSSPRNSPRPSLRSQLLFLAGIVVLAAGAFYTALVVATQIDRIFLPGNEIRIGGPIGSLPGLSSARTSDVVGGSRINVLVMGMDRRPEEGNAATRTDTMFVMTIDPSSRTARGLAIPRDLLVDIPTRSGSGSVRRDRVNTVFATGEYGGYPGGGPALVKQVVGELLDIKIHYYVVIDFEGFKQIIDLLGGIDVEVSERLAVNDPYYSETERLGDFYPCIFPPGQYHMNGSQALCYARVRRGSNDYERILRQQLIVYAVMDKADKLNVLANADALWKRYKNSITTDINDLQLPGFVQLASSIDRDQVALMSLAAATVPWTDPVTGAALLLASKEGIAQIREAFLADNSLLRENAMVEVQNGTGEEGLATRALAYFKDLGIAEARLLAENAAAPNHTRTEIIDFTGKTYTARFLARALRVGDDRVRKSTAADAALRHSEADIVVILGSDHKLETAAASGR